MHYSGAYIELLFVRARVPDFVDSFTLTYRKCILESKLLMNGYLFPGHNSFGKLQRMLCRVSPLTPELRYSKIRF